MYALAVQNSPKARNGSTRSNLTATDALRERFNRRDALVEARKPFDKSIPAHCRAREHLPPITLLDGEIVALGTNGRISFNPPTPPLKSQALLLFYVFDVLKATAAPTAALCPPTGLWERGRHRKLSTRVS